MRINNSLILLAISIITGFGVVFVIKYFKTGDIFLDQLIPALVGTVLLTASLVWRRKYKRKITYNK